jgi:hypothetical protein
MTDKRGFGDLIEALAQLVAAARVAQRAVWDRAIDSWTCWPSEIEPGMRVKLRAQALYSMGVLAGPLTQQTWIVLSCACSLCQLGQHALVEQDRHIARAALRPADWPCIDELCEADADRQSLSVQAGMLRAIRRGRPSNDNGQGG